MKVGLNHLNHMIASAPPTITIFGNEARYFQFVSASNAISMGKTLPASYPAQISSKQDSKSILCPKS